MINYLKNVLTAGVAVGIIAFGSGCGSESEKPQIPGSDITYTDTNDNIDNDSGREDLYDSNIDTGIDAIVGDAEDAEMDANEDLYDIGIDSSVDAYDAETDANEDLYDIGIDSNADAYNTETDANADLYDAGIDASVDAYDTNSSDEVEEILSCTNLNSVPACLGDDYTTLVSTGLEVSKALQLGYVGVMTGQNTISLKKIVSGNPCALPEYFSNETCVDWVNSNPEGIATVKLLDQETVEIQGNLLERIAALTKLAKGDLQGTECIVTGTDPNTAEVSCNEQSEE